MSVTAPQGFRAAGVAAGVGPDGRRDVAVVVNDGPSRAAGAVFTTHPEPAAPLLWSRQVPSRRQHYNTVRDADATSTWIRARTPAHPGSSERQSKDTGSGRPRSPARTNPLEPDPSALFSARANGLSRVPDSRASKGG